MAREIRRMLRTIFMIGLFAILGLIALRVVFGILPAVIGLFISIALFAIKIAAIGFVIYLLIRVFSPDTARRLREKWSGPAV
jgi:hypothetical protein